MFDRIWRPAYNSLKRALTAESFFSRYSMSNSPARSPLHVLQNSTEQTHAFESVGDKKSPAPVLVRTSTNLSTRPESTSPQPDPLLTAEDVAERLNVTKDWVWDHSSRKHPFLPVIRMSDGTLRYRASRIETFIDERERLTQLRRKHS